MFAERRDLPAFLLGVFVKSCHSTGPSALERPEGDPRPLKGGRQTGRRSSLSWKRLPRRRRRGSLCPPGSLYRPCLQTRRGGESGVTRAGLEGDSNCSVQLHHSGKHSEPKLASLPWERTTAVAASRYGFGTDGSWNHRDMTDSRKPLVSLHLCSRAGYLEDPKRGLTFFLKLMLS